MNVTDLDVAAVRAFLEGDQQKHRQLRDQLDGRDGYSALLFTAFYEALKRKFGKHGGREEIIEFVGDVRSRSEKAESDIDPLTAEQVIRNVLHSEVIADIDDATVVQYQVMLLAVLVSDEAFDDDQLDKFLATARTLADHMLNA